MTIHYDEAIHAGIDIDTMTDLHRPARQRSTQMYTMHEALAREHMRQRHQEARQHALARELASARRWRNLERRAHAAYRRHAQRADMVALASAVAD